MTWRYKECILSIVLLKKQIDTSREQSLQKRSSNKRWWDEIEVGDGAMRRVAGVISSYFTAATTSTTTQANSSSSSSFHPKGMHQQS